MNIKKRLSFFFNSLKPQDAKFVNAILCGVELKLIKGTVREKEDQDDAWWFYLAKNHNVIFDIGCNIGYTALLALIQNPNKDVLLVDPNPKALQMAALNLIENGLGSKVHYCSAFVSNTLDEKVKFYTVGSGAAGSMYASHAKTAASLNAFSEVKTVTLDFLFSFYNIKPDLVKIDVEGAETLVIQSAKELANQTKCTFFIEMHNVENLGMEAAGQEMLNWCNKLNYKAWYLKTGEELLSAKTIKGRGKCHLLLLPKEKPYPEYLEGVIQNAQLPKYL